MTDIGVYTSIETLEEKKRYSEDVRYIVWWALNILPSKEKPDRMFFAAEGKWQGYFTVELVNGYRVYLDEWHELEEKPERTPFRGFTYNVPEVVG